MAHQVRGAPSGTHKLIHMLRLSTKTEMSFKSNHNSEMLKQSICLTVSISISIYLSVNGAISCCRVNAINDMRLNNERKAHFSCRLLTPFILINEAAAFACRLSHDY